MSARTTCAVEDARRLLGPHAIIGLSIKTVAHANAAPLDQLDYVGVGGVYAHDLEGQSRSADRRRGPARHRRGVPQAHARPAGLRHRRHRRRQCGAGDRGRRRRRRGDLGAVDGKPIPQAAARELRAWSMRRSPGGRSMTADRGHHRGLGLRRRRRHPGRPENLLGARRLWRLGDHGADRAEHQGRHRHPRRAGAFHHGADRCGVLRSRCQRREDRHAVAAGRDRGGRGRARAQEQTQDRARSGDGRDLRRPAARARRDRRAQARR